MRKNKIDFRFLKNDISAGLVVFLVALPLCLGIALASGAPLFSGVIAGIVGGIVVSFFSGSELSVSGPAAGLTVIVLNSIHSLGNYETFLLAIVLAGLIQIALGIIKAGIVGYYFPSSVIKGMLAAIGLILIFKQIPHALGYDKDSEGDFSFIQVDGENTFSEILNSLNLFHPGAILISIVSLAILIIWEKNISKSGSILQLVPGALIAVLVAVGMNELFINTGSILRIYQEDLVQLPESKNLTEFVHQFTLPDFTAFANTKVYVIAFTLAIVGSLESLLSLEATDKLDPEKRTSSTNKELIAQGIGNTISGMIGGLPLTAVIVRSSANINAGAKTRISSILHGILLLVSVLFIPHILNKIPLACLAAVLLLVGYKLAKLSLFKSMYKLGWNQFMPFVFTIAAILFTDLLKGIAIGVVVSVFYILRNNFRLPYYYFQSEHNNKSFITIEFSEHITFINKGNIISLLDKLPANSNVIIDASKTKFIDLDIIEILHNFKKTAEANAINLQYKSIPDFMGEVQSH